MKNMGSLESIIGMIPGMGSKLKGVKLDDKQFVRTEAIICSMTKKELHIQELKTNHLKHRKTNLHLSTNVLTMSLLIIVPFGVRRHLASLLRKAFIKSPPLKFKTARLWMSSRATSVLGTVLSEEKLPQRKRMLILT